MFKGVPLSECHASKVASKKIHSTSTPKIKKCCDADEKKLMEQKTRIKQNKYEKKRKRRTDLEENMVSPKLCKLDNLRRRQSISTLIVADGNIRKSTNKPQISSTRQKHVHFSPKLNRKSLVVADCNPDKTMMGYDWIATMLENKTPVEDLSDEFFEQIEEFRRLNCDECKSSYKPTPANDKENEPTFKRRFLMPEIENKNLPICCKGNGVYTLNNRLHPVPIHGPYSTCPTCQKRPTCLDQSYVRVSIPLRAVSSPYNLRPHRRKSYDPSDSVALSEHCLAGWQNSKPGRVPAPENVDLVSHSAKKGLKSLRPLDTYH